MRKRIMVIGPDDMDKEKLTRLIEGTSSLPRVNSMVYLDQTIQVPSSYLRGAGMMKHIIATQQNASAILMVLSAERRFPVYSPNFAKVFRIPSIGIILIEKDTNRDQDIASCRAELKAAKVGCIQEVNLNNPQQYQELLHTIRLIKEGMI